VATDRGSRGLPQMRQPRLAEMIAARLREDILTGRLKEGDSLPRHEALFTEFRVSLPAVREAMRILETESLISVRRGNVGGAIVHLPTADRVAQMISMVLQARNTTPDDVSSTLLKLEPICAGMCAARPDRAETVVPALGEVIAAQQAEFDDPRSYNANARRFHEALVGNCGSDTMQLLIGSLEVIWSGHESSVWQEAMTGMGADPEPGSPMAIKTRRAALRDHEKLLAAIEAGNVDRATSLAAAHLQATRASTLTSSEHATIKANLVGVPQSADGAGR
jgi:GntR family transcriptional regulator, transcriptional repressor for pyruvate dehydrogenase complex